MHDDRPESVWITTIVQTPAGSGIADLPQFRSGGAPGYLLGVVLSETFQSLTLQQPTSGARPVLGLTGTAGTYYPVGSSLDWGGRIILQLPGAAPPASCIVSMHVIPSPSPYCETP